MHKSPRRDASERRRPESFDHQLQELLGLLQGADSVELKLTVPDADRRSTVVALGMDPLDAFLRQVYFFDTPDLALNRAGIVTRARRSQGKPDDSVVKLRPVDPGNLSDEVRQSKLFGVEVDAMPGGFVCSGSFKEQLEHGHVKETLVNEGPLHNLFSKQQRAFFAEHAPDGLGLEQLAVLGRVTLLKLKFEPEGYGRKIVAELWVYPDGFGILELSTKCKPVEAFDVAVRTRVYLKRACVNLSGSSRQRPARRSSTSARSCPNSLVAPARLGLSGLRRLWLHHGSDKPQQREEDPEEEHPPVSISEGYEPDREQQGEVQKGATNSDPQPHDFPPGVRRFSGAYIQTLSIRPAWGPVIVLMA